jgi:uncharacterized protein
MAKLIGRIEEVRLLHELEQTDQAAFVAVYGRRRIGKTFLINQVFKSRFTFHLTGMANVDNGQQLVNFHAAYVRQFPAFEDLPVPMTWFEAFQRLITAIEADQSDQKKVLFLDELPWLSASDTQFVSSLEHFWNSWACHRDDILLIVCGSAASWMLNELINNTGGLYNRVTHQIALEQLNLAECEAFLKQKSPAITRYQVLQLYMVFGGIPFYLEAIDPKKSAAQNINHLCFTRNGAFKKEFYRLFESLFKKSEKHVRVVEVLATRLSGVERTALLTQANLADGGNSTIVLRELEDSGFIRRYHQVHRPGTAIYQLADFYTMFYLRFIKGQNQLDEDFWITGLDKPEIRAWSGYAFEQICTAHLRQLKVALGISNVQTQTSHWQGEGSDGKAQIDLVIDRRDEVINICEMKFSLRPFQIDKPYADVLNKKLSVFREQTKTKKALWLTMVTTYGVEENSYARELGVGVVDMEGLFGW